MRLPRPYALIFPAFAVAAGVAVAQPPPPPGSGPGGGSLPPLKQKQAAEEDAGDRPDRPRPRRASAPMSMMNGVEMTTVESAAEEPVTASGNVDLWRARIAEQRARQERAIATSGDAPQ